MKNITKNIILGVSIFGLLIAYYLYNSSADQFSDGNCWNVLIECTKFKWVFALSIFAPVFIFSLATYKLSERVFKPWAWFSAIFSGIYIYIVESSKPGRSDGFSPTIIQTILFIWTVYSIISITIILIQIFRTKSK